MWISLLDGLLTRIFRAGDLGVTMPDGRRFTYGDGTAPHIQVELRSANLPRRIVTSPELAVGEAYMDGDLIIQNDDLYGFLRLGMQNLRGRRAPTFRNRSIPGQRALSRWLKQYNPVRKAQSNVAHHYDLSGDLYDLFLDRDKQYSCGYFRTADDTLEQAQTNKKALIARKLMIEPGMKVLDIGCGWGGMAITLARDYGAQVTGITLSKEQLSVASARVEQAGLADKITLHLMDYRRVDDVFDRIVSVGMFEHVGVPHYREYFQQVSRLLSPNGIALLHTIGRPTPPNTTSPWVTKYIFPGGYVPAMSEVVTAIEDEGLFITDVEVWRLHYAYTIKHWYDRFMANHTKAAALYDERFCRMWRYYLVASELTFRMDLQNVFQFQLTHNQEAAPLTRDYLCENQPIK